MTLFAALTAKEGTAPGGGAASSTPPEAVQLHAERVIDFLEGRTVPLAVVAAQAGGEGNKEEGGVKSRQFAALSYQAVQTQQDDGPLPGKNAGGRHARPDLGVWDCRVDGSSAAASSMLLKRVAMGRKIEPEKVADPSGEESNGEESNGEESKGESKADKNDDRIKPILLAVDISEPSEVQPAVEKMRQVILNVVDDKDSADISNPRVCTTTIKALQNAQFGKSKIQEEVAVKGGASSTEPRIALILAVIVPSNRAASSVSAADEFVEKQARALLLYHLHKFALETNCTLCFVSEKGGSSSTLGDASGGGDGEEKKTDAAGENNPLLGRNSTMSVDELGQVVRRVAMGLPAVEEGDMMQPPGEEEKEESKGGDAASPPSIHAPGSHDAELIHGAYLRNASCEGRWDAGKDNLEVALPPRTTTSSNDSSAKEEKVESNGDEEWLAQLASSIGVSTDSAPASAASSRATTPTRGERKERAKKPVAKTKRTTRSAAARSKDSKPKDEKEVMNFFDNLLKK